VPAGSPADFLRGDDDATDDPDDPAEIEVLAENWDTVQVFTRCRQTWAAGMGGAFAQGFSALEIEAACRLARVEPDTWPEVSDQVHEMGRIAAEELNSRRK
jgi:hypothetical protein